MHPSSVLAVRGKGCYVHVFQSKRLKKVCFLLTEMGHVKRVFPSFYIGKENPEEVKVVVCAGSEPKKNG